MPHRNISTGAAPRIWGVAPKSTRASSRKVRDLPHISRHSRKTNQMKLSTSRPSGVAMKSRVASELAAYRFGPSCPAAMGLAANVLAAALLATALSHSVYSRRACFPRAFQARWFEAPELRNGEGACDTLLNRRSLHSLHRSFLLL